MKYITEPKVYLVTRPTVDWAQIAAFLFDEDLPIAHDSIRANQAAKSNVKADAVAAVETAARLCYMSFGKGRRDPKAFIDNLLASGHGSVFEHVNYGFIFTGVSRSLTHELVRHRAGFAYSQLSQRYVDESDAAFVVPPELPEGSHAMAEFESSLSVAMQVYDAVVEDLDEIQGGLRERRKRVRQAARSVLPNATETKIFVTANVRAWRHFIELRASEHADAEIRRLAIAVLKVLQDEAPLLFGDFEIDGETATPKYRRV